MSHERSETKEDAAPAEERSERRDRRLLRFGVFELDPEETELRRAGVRVRVQAQPLRLLALLAEQPQRLVSRDEIRRHLWGDDVHVDSEQGINFSIRRIRQALGDSAAAPRFIETVPGAGYRFLADVEEVNGDTAVPGPSAAGRPASASWRIGIAVALPVVALGLWGLGTKVFIAGEAVEKSEVPRREAPVSEPPRILVLPFEGLSAGEGQGSEYRAAAMTEEVIRALGRQRGGVLEVMAVTTVRRLKQAAVPPSNLGADFLVDGRVDPGAGSTGLRISVRLMDADGVRRLWSNAYDAAETTELPRVAEHIARAVALHFEGEPGEPVRLSLSQRPQAYDAYLEGRRLLGQWLYRYGPGSEEGVERARRRLEEAVTLDPGFAPPYVELARYHLWRHGVEETESRARSYLETALALDRQLEDAHVELASLALFWDLDPETARRHLERALELHPSHAAALRHRATYLLVTDRPEEAAHLVHRYRGLDPLDPVTALHAVWHLFVAGRLEEARRVGVEAMAIQPRCTDCLRTLVLVEEQLGQPAQALRWARREADLRGAGGERLESLADYRRWRLATAPRRSSPTARAALHLALGRRKEALDLLEQAVWDREDWVRVYLRRDPRFDPLRGDPRFEAILERLFG